MARNMSFMLTTKQFIDQTKTVTRRPGWLFLKVGDILNGCEKCQGLQKGEKIVKLGQIRVVDVRREQLRKITEDDIKREGFPDMNWLEFVRFFCKHMGTKPHAEVTRIEFEYLVPLPKPEQLSLFAGQDARR